VEAVEVDQILLLVLLILLAAVVELEDLEKD
jgi:hypothetical protein